MTILVTGATGKTGKVLLERLHAANIPFVATSRSGKVSGPYKTAVFDWFDASTYENPFKVDAAIDRAYLVVPMMSHEIVHVKAFIDFALSKGVKRFVLLSATQFEPAGRWPMGKIHQYIVDSGADYAVLRPTWFHENFEQMYLTSICERDEIASASADGKMAFVSTEDITSAAVEALTAEKSLNKSVFLFGPELLSYEEAAKLFTTILGREIKYRQLTLEEGKAALRNLGLREEHANMLAFFESETANHVEENLFNANTGDSSTKWVGKRTVEQYIRENKATWSKQ